MTKTSVRVRGRATRAMKYASGNARIASVTVTAAAIPTVRPAILRYVGSVVEKIVRKLSRFQMCSSFPVKESTVQKDETNRIEREPR